MNSMSMSKEENLSTIICPSCAAVYYPKEGWKKTARDVFLAMYRWPELTRRKCPKCFWKYFLWGFWAKKLNALRCIFKRQSSKKVCVHKEEPVAIYVCAGCGDPQGCDLWTTCDTDNGKCGKFDLCKKLLKLSSDKKTNANTVSICREGYCTQCEQQARRERFTNV